VEHGQSTLEELRRLVETDARAAWIRAVAANVAASPSSTLVAHAIVGPHPESWRPRVWRYESCTFVEGPISNAQLVEILNSDVPVSLSINSETLAFQASLFNSIWQHKPSFAPHDQPQVPYPSRVHTLHLANSEKMSAPTDFLVGQGDVRSFSVFTTAFDEFFRGGKPVTGSMNPQLGEMSIRIIDEQARIEGVERVGDQLEVHIAGSSLTATTLEFSSQSHSEMRNVAGLESVLFDLPANELPRDSWLWLKKNGDWLDYRHLQPLGGYVSPDVELDTEEHGALSVENITTQTPSARWLRDRAISSTIRALSLYVNDELRDFPMFAGHAIELACKALLADQNLAFLAPERSFPVTLTLWKFRDDIERLPTGTPTIGAKVAFQRLTDLHPAMEELRSGVTELLAQRNGEVHLGVIDATTQNRTIVSFVKAMNVLLGISDEEFDAFWSPHSELVRSILDDNAKQVQRAVQLKISAAIEQFKVIQSLPLGHRDAVVSVISSQQSEPEIDEATVKCPACQSIALATGANELEVGDVSVHRDGTIEGVESWLEFTPLSLRCPYCGLHLENRAELAAAGIESSWINDDEEVKQAIMQIDPSIYEYVDISDYEDNVDE
jgi:hypothetical protein